MDLGSGKETPPLQVWLNPTGRRRSNPPPMWLVRGGARDDFTELAFLVDIEHCPWSSFRFKGQSLLHFSVVSAHVSGFTNQGPPVETSNYSHYTILFPFPH